MPFKEAVSTGDLEEAYVRAYGGEPLIRLSREIPLLRVGAGTQSQTKSQKKKPFHRET